MKKQYICNILSVEPVSLLFQVIVDREDDEHLFLVDVKAKQYIQREYPITVWDYTAVEEPFPIADEEQGKYPSESVAVIGEFLGFLPESKDEGQSNPRSMSLRGDNISSKKKRGMNR